jgi:hypothetical protein
VVVQAGLLNLDESRKPRACRMPGKLHADKAYEDKCCRCACRRRVARRTFSMGYAFVFLAYSFIYFSALRKKYGNALFSALPTLVKPFAASSAC